MQLNANRYRIWFTHKVNRYETMEISPGKKTLKKTPEIVKMDWDNWALDVVGRLPDGKTRIVFRSKSKKISKYMGDKPVGIRYMLGVDITKASLPKIEQYELSEDNSKVRDNFDARKGQTNNNQRVVFQLTTNIGFGIGMMAKRALRKAKYTEFINWCHLRLNRQSRSPGVCSA